MTILNKVNQAFESLYRSKPSHTFRAPGRVNLIGEHTDYNGGFVLPCAINFETIVVANKRDDNIINVIALDYQQQDRFEVNQPITRHQSYQWANYVRGVANSLQQQGLTLSGCDLAIAGNVPQGAGLSSSASLEVALGLAYSTLSSLELSAKDNALNGQDAENHFVGCNCGIMDQLISAQGVAGNALLIDCRSLETQEVSIPDNLSVVIINSNVKRGLVDSEYNTRRQQCEEAAQVFEVKALRDIDQHFFEQHQHLLSDVVAKRARHVISENARTLAAAKALAQRDIAYLSELMAQSHASMRDDFEITVPAIDKLVEIVDSVIGLTGGVRMTGGGFGGCVVALVPHELVAEVEQAVATNYPLESGLDAQFYVCQPSQGASRL